MDVGSEQNDTLLKNMADDKQSDTPDSEDLYEKLQTKSHKLRQSIIRSLLSTEDVEEELSKREKEMEESVFPKDQRQWYLQWTPVPCAVWDTPSISFT